MTEEIKIDGNSIQIGNKICYCVDKDLIDYITNLQYEKEMLDKDIFWLRNDLNIYKSRCEKAIEYIKAYYLLNDNKFNMKNVFNILQGSDEE